MLLKPARPFGVDGLEARGMTDQPRTLDAQGPGDRRADGDDHGEGQQQGQQQCYGLRELCSNARCNGQTTATMKMAKARRAKMERPK